MIRVKNFEDETVVRTSVTTALASIENCSCVARSTKRALQRRVSAAAVRHSSHGGDRRIDGALARENRLLGKIFCPVRRPARKTRLRSQNDLACWTAKRRASGEGMLMLGENPKISIDMGLLDLRLATAELSGHWDGNKHLKYCLKFILACVEILNGCGRNYEAN